MFLYIYNFFVSIFWWILPSKQIDASKRDEPDVENENKGAKIKENKKNHVLKKINMEKIKKISMII